MIDTATAEFCRQIEGYLCRKNDGHLVRIVGPAFEQVCGWAARGVPLRVAFSGIDRSFERYYAKGPRRRPIRIEFCEADVLDAFDEWRRALGVVAGPTASSGGTASEATPAEAPDRRRPALASHLERLIARLTSARPSARPIEAHLDGLIREIDTLSAAAKGSRGPAREAVVTRLRSLDEALLAAAREVHDAAALASIRQEADEELRPFRGRMPGGEYDRAHSACVDRIIRERLKLPTLVYEA